MIAIKTMKPTVLAGVIFLIASCTMTFAQEEVDPSELIQKREGRMWRLGKEAIRTGNSYLALRYFEEIYHKDTTDLDLIMEMAELYRHTHNYPKTELFYTKIVKSKRIQKYPEAYFYLAQAQKSNLKYKEAKENLLIFKKNLKGVQELPLKKLFKTELEGCEMMLAKGKDSVTLVVRNLGKGVNHPHIDFSPISIGEGKLIYGSYAEDKERIFKVDENGEVKTEKRTFFMAQKVKGEWKSTGPWSEELSDTTMDIANGCFSLDSTRFYFAKCTTNWQYKVVCTIYETKKVDGEWRTPKPMNELINMPEFTSSHPAIGRESKNNQEVLYFVSNREKGRGGMDIWFSEYDSRKKVFKKPRNAGSKINSAGDEMTPFYDLQSKTLYFSTNGRANIGGLDIYSAVGETSKWEESKNMGTEINSSADDLDYTIRSSNRGGYFVSNRIGGLSLYHPTCCDDIYEFEFSKYIDILAQVQVQGANKEELGEDVVVNVYLVDENNKLLVITAENDMREMNLRPGQKYVIEAKKEGYFTNTVEVTTEGIIDNTKLKRLITLEKMPQKPMVIPNINFEFDSPKLTPESKITVDTTLLVLFKRQPNIKIEISAHTDSKGSDAYNLSLSQKRAESIVKYLNSQGVPLRQMIPKGYGEVNPIAPNTNADGTDNPEGRRLNRRVEFSILGEVEPEYIEEEKEKIEIEIEQ